MKNEIKRATGLLVIEVVNSNPNGDPDRESDPRQRPTGIGEISPVSFKRKLRDLVEDAEGQVFNAVCDKLKIDKDKKANYKILESRGRNRDEIIAEMGKDIKKFNHEEFINSKFVKKYWDARIFGNTFLEKEADKGYIKTGVAQFVMGTSIAPVQIIRHTNTNKPGVQEGKNQGMAPLAYRIVEHGVYCMPFYINPSNAHKSGCTTEDIEMLKALIPYSYDHTRSAIRPDVRLRHAWYVEHKNPLGSCADYKLIEALIPKPKEKLKVENNDDLKSSSSWDDYDVPSSLPDEFVSKVESCVDLIETI
ncbi:MAG: type I CRISPR-associated protein Cas7 [Spirochaetes bacterium]|nr:type I CRISPR-associated protein Cas7 [Spirochaetota bacterium]